MVLPEKCKGEEVPATRGCSSDSQRAQGEDTALTTQKLQKEFWAMPILGLSAASCFSGAHFEGNSLFPSGARAAGTLSTTCTVISFAHLLGIMSQYLKWDGWISLCVARGVSDQEGILILPLVSLHCTESNNHIIKRQCILVPFMIPFLRNWRICLKFQVLVFLW